MEKTLLRLDGLFVPPCLGRGMGIESVERWGLWKPADGRRRRAPVQDRRVRQCPFAYLTVFTTGAYLTFVLQHVKYWLLLQHFLSLMVLQRLKQLLTAKVRAERQLTAEWSETQSDVCRWLSPKRRAIIDVVVVAISRRFVIVVGACKSFPEATF